MIKTKKTLYETLEIQSTANLKEIERAYQTLTENLTFKEKIIGVEEAQTQKKVIDMAYGILSNPVSRDAYDAKLFASKTSPNKEQKVEVSVAINESNKSPLRRVLAVIAGVMVISLAMQLIYGFIVYRANNGQIATVNQQDEKMKIRQYYQEYGVWLKSGEEVDMHLAEERKNERDRYKKQIEDRQKEYEKSVQERKYQDWLDQGKRTSEEIDRQSRQALQQAQQELEHKKELEENEKRKKAAAERDRINNERIKLGLPPVYSNSDEDY